LLAYIYGRYDKNRGADYAAFWLNFVYSFCVNDIKNIDQKSFFNYLYIFVN